MRSLFRKLFGDSRDTERLIFDIAEYNRDSDFEELYKRLNDATLYMPVERTSLPDDMLPGHLFQVRSGDQIRACTVDVPTLGTCLSVATHESAEMLKGGHVCIQWQEFLKMTQACNTAGALVQGKTSWVALDNERIRCIQSRSGA